MKFLKAISFAACTALVVSSCTKEEAIVTNELQEADIKITHNYTYKGETHSVDLMFNEENELKTCYGDVEAHMELFQEKDNAPSAFLVESINEDQTVFDIRIFDNSADMDKYYAKELGTLVPMDEAKNCTHWSDPNQGTANFLFYYDVNYGNRMTFLDIWNVTYFQWWGFAHANDQLSSVQMWGNNGHGVVLDLFEHTCFSGNTVRLTSSVANLHTLTFQYITDVIRDRNGGWQVVSYPAGHWGDKTSSAKGWYTS